MPSRNVVEIAGAISSNLKLSGSSQRSVSIAAHPRGIGGPYARRPPIAPAIAERIREALKGGMSIRKTAAKFGVNKSTVQRITSPFAAADASHAAA